MEKFNLNGQWRITSNTYEVVGEASGSVYAALLANGKWKLLSTVTWRKTDIFSAKRTGISTYSVCLPIKKHSLKL